MRMVLAVITYELFIIIILLSVFRVDLHGLLDEVDGFARSRGGIVFIAERAAAGLVLLETREVLQRELQQIPRLVPQDLHGKALQKLRQALGDFYTHFLTVKCAQKFGPVLRVYVQQSVPFRRVS